MTRLILTILAIISASIHMWGEYQGPDYLIFIFKPLTMVFIILIAVLAKDPPNKRYKIAIIAGLVFSMIGDVLLSLPIPFAVYGILIFVILLPGLNTMTLPVAAYVIVIMVMAWQAWDQWDDKRTQWALLAFIGAVLFVVSDSLLAINKFGEPFLAARALTLTTYFSAQWLIANSNYTQQR